MPNARLTPIGRSFASPQEKRIVVLRRDAVKLAGGEPGVCPGGCLGARKNQAAPSLEEEAMPKEAHSKAAEHHEKAAKSHRAAAEHHEKGHTEQAEMHSKDAHASSKMAHEHSDAAHKKSGARK
jgi:hypothetical protein